MPTRDELKGDLLGTADALYDAGVADGRLQQADADAQVISGLQARIAELEQGEAARSPQAGVYNSGNSPLLAIDGTPLTVASFYLRYDQKPSAVDNLVAALDAGQDVMVAVDSKRKGGTYDPYADFTAGKHDDAWGALRADVLGLLDRFPDREIRLSWVHEANLRPSQNKCAATDTAATYIASANRFADFMHEGHNDWLVVNHWIATPTGAAPYLPDGARFDMCSGDMYKVGDHPAAETATGTWKPLADFFDKAGWTTQRRFITETGIKTDVFRNGGHFTTEQQIDWHRSIPAALADESLGFEGFIWFETMGTNHDYRPTDPSVIPAFAEMVGSL